MKFFEELVDTTDFPERWHCGTWTETHGWVHIISDLAIFAAYTAIPIVLVYFILKRKDLFFPKVLWLFVAFIFACGTSHLLEATIFWKPWYRLAGSVKVITALVSWLTVVTLIRITPKLLVFPSLAVANKKLKSEIELRKSVERQLREKSENLDKANKELKEAKIAAEASGKIKSQFLANMSHEIRTPMTAILGYSEMLLEDIDEQKKEQAINVVIESTNNLLELINSILDLSKIEAGKLEVDLIKFSPFKTFENIRALMEPLAIKKGLDFQFVIANEIPETILSDPMRIRQILINLVGNAIKFTTEGTILICVCFGEDDLDGLPAINISVFDQGIGMSNEQMEKLFKPFSQVDSSITRDYGGTGLGLSISKKLVDLLGGEIVAYSRPQKGTIFRFSIPTGPIQGVQRFDENPKLIETQNRQFREVFQDEFKILLAEDNIVNQKLIKRILEKSGGKVQVVENGREAVESTLSAEQNGEPFDVILMDMQMPILGGLEATRELRQGGCKLPIIALTANAMPGDRDQCLSAGCDDFATKPIDRAMLIGQINEYCG